MAGGSFAFDLCEGKQQGFITTNSQRDRIDAYPDSRGSIGVGELGVTWAATADWTFDASIQGFVGQRQGVAGSVTAAYRF